jgi:hypothetical protein
VVIVTYAMKVSCYYWYKYFDSKLWLLLHTLWQLVVLIVTYAMIVSSGYCYVCYVSKLLLLLHMVW